MKTIPFEPLDPSVYRQIVRRALAEDLGWGDVTTEATVGADVRGHGTIVVKAPCVLAGLDVAAEAFRQLDPGGAHHAQESRWRSRARRATIAAEVRGAAALDADRRANRAQFPAAPVGNRHADAALCRCCRRQDHDPRHAQDHADAARAREVCGARRRRQQPSLGSRRRHSDQGQPCSARRRRRGSGQTDEGGAAGNARSKSKRRASPMSRRRSTPARTSSCSTTCRSSRFTRRSARIAGRAKIEISGGVTLDRMPELARTGADYVSVGALTHSAPAVDLSFEIEPGCLIRSRRPRRRAARRSVARRGRMRRTALLFSRNRLRPTTSPPRYAERGAPEGTTVVAATQTSGRGRLGRTLVLPAWRRPVFLDRHPRGAGGAVPDARWRRRCRRGHSRRDRFAARDQVAERCRHARRRRAVAAAEARRRSRRGSTSADGLQHVILGIGINISPSSYPPELADRASSIETELGRPIDAAWSWRRCWRRSPPSSSRSREARSQVCWRAGAACALGARARRSSATSPRGRVSGIAAGIADDGALLVRVGNRSRASHRAVR